MARLLGADPRTASRAALPDARGAPPPPGGPGPRPRAPRVGQRRLDHAGLDDLGVAALGSRRVHAAARAGRRRTFRSTQLVARRARRAFAAWSPSVRRPRSWRGAFRAAGIECPGRTDRRARGRDGLRAHGGRRGAAFLARLRELRPVPRTSGSGPWPSAARSPGSASLSATPAPSRRSTMLGQRGLYLEGSARLRASRFHDLPELPQERRDRARDGDRPARGRVAPSSAGSTLREGGASRARASRARAAPVRGLRADDRPAARAGLEEDAVADIWKLLPALGAADAQEGRADVSGVRHDARRVPQEGAPGLRAGLRGRSSAHIGDLLERVHGARTHVGRASRARRERRPSTRTRAMRAVHATCASSSTAAIREEAYESAARLRDEIKTLEAGVKSTV